MSSGMVWASSGLRTSCSILLSSTEIGTSQEVSPRQGVGPRTEHQQNLLGRLSNKLDLEFDGFCGRLCLLPMTITENRFVGL